MQRQRLIEAWLGELRPGRSFELAPASADASFRRYFRAALDDGSTCIVMDAPPDREDVRPWLHVQSLFQSAGVNVPRVLATDMERGFLLLSDLGSTTYPTFGFIYQDADASRFAQAQHAAVVVAQNAANKVVAAMRPGASPMQMLGQVADSTDRIAAMIELATGQGGTDKR